MRVGVRGLGLGLSLGLGLGLGVGSGLGLELSQRLASRGVEHGGGEVGRAVEADRELVAARVPG